MSFGAICGVSLTSLTTAGMRVLREDLAHVGGGTLGKLVDKFLSKRISIFLPSLKLPQTDK